MDDNHHMFGWSNLVFYDAPQRWEADTSQEFSVTNRETPEDWHRFTEDIWVTLRPVSVSPPPQGWKIHVSAGLDNAEKVLATVWEYCVRHGLPFKHLRDRNMQLLLNSKYAPRASSGKLAALYPADQDECRKVLENLSQSLDGEQGPYVLSDLRWGQGPLYVRYAGFHHRQVLTDDGELTLAVSRPDGKLVPDQRKPVFSPPGWAVLPDFLQPHLEARRTGGISEFPYRIERALHFSNAGGVYLAHRSADESRVVLKEARPLAGVDRDGQDAVSRLRRERRILDQLAGIPGIPRVLDYRTAWEHEFLVLEEMSGDALFLWAGREHVLLQPDPTEDEVARYTTLAVDLLERVGQLLDQVHARGVCFGDLHPGNVLVAEDGSVSFVDFETAFRQDETYRPAMGAQGFAAPWRDCGIAMDRHAYAATRLWAFLPVNRIFPLGPRKVAQTVRAIADRFPLPAGYGDQILRDMGCEDGRNDQVPPALPPALATERRRLLGQPSDTELGAGVTDWPAIRNSLAAAIRLSATPERADRLFPGDPRQFRYGGAGFAYGAAGVLWALSATGTDRSPAAEEWLLAAVRAGLPPQPGFYTGLHGVAYVLDHLGHPDEAHSVLTSALPLTTDLNSVSLFHGLSGVGLNLLHFALRYGDAAHWRQVEEVADRLGQAVAARWRPGAEKRAGLMHGWSGPALFFTRLFEATGDPHHLDQAIDALGHDVRECVSLDNGTLQVLEAGRRTLAYLESGSAGIALAASQVLAHRDTPELATAVRQSASACRTELIVETHLFNGRAGLLAALIRLRHHGLGFDTEAVIQRHLRGFGWLALSYQGRLAFAGDQSLRLSMDLATGNAGVLLGLATVFDESTELLPFLRPR